MNRRKLKAWNQIAMVNRTLSDATTEILCDNPRKARSHVTECINDLSALNTMLMEIEAVGGND